MTEDEELIKSLMDSIRYYNAIRYYQVYGSFGGTIVWDTEDDKPLICKDDPGDGMVDCDGNPVTDQEIEEDLFGRAKTPAPVICAD
jgi:hypothetical protein